MPARWPGLLSSTLSATSPMPVGVSLHQTPSSGCGKWLSWRKFKTANSTRPAVATASNVACKRFERFVSIPGDTYFISVARQLPCHGVGTVDSAIPGNALRIREISTPGCTGCHHGWQSGRKKMQEIVGRLCQKGCAYANRYLDQQMRFTRYSGYFWPYVARGPCLRQ